MRGFIKWWNTTSWSVKVVFPFTFIVAIGGAIKTWHDYELWTPASTTYVKTEINRIEPILIEIQVQLYEGKLEQVEELIFRWNKELTDGRGNPELIRSRIKELENNHITYRRKLDVLRKIREKN